MEKEEDEKVLNNSLNPFIFLKKAHKQILIQFNYYRLKRKRRKMRQRSK